MVILGIETSCDETAAAVVADGRRLLSDIVATQFDLHARYGGVVPELAARRHQENILPVIRAALAQAQVGLRDLQAIAVTQGPGLIGALVIGFAVAKSLAYTLNIPLVGVHHLHAHLAAPFLTERPPAFPFIALVVSGGHTNLYHVASFQEIRLLGRSRDDAAGEAFDKVAKLMQLGYPGGVAIERLSQGGDSQAFALPRPRIDTEPLTFSYSGLKTAVAAVLRKDPEILGRPRGPADLAASFQAAVVDSLVSRALLATQLHNCPRLVVAGGVAANRRLRHELEIQCAAAEVELFLPSLKLCTDNAAMVAVLGYHLLQAGERLDLRADVFARG
ncbi:MAG: tRNA (adenosine(37)-N6)-threonylcarbamoyltransferase complex transferase subunit TsaD [Deltaproteobacteria bacterium]|nr:tRNA (adenosine(37)-N6)-threonylcarbamoyltransferase complex transferase subunit TsaD [Deltaproteobacteria bacterium]